MKTPLSVTFLGTGTSQGIPVIGSDHPVCKSTDAKDKRLRVSVLLEWSEYKVVIDCGPDFRQQMLRQQCKRLDAILLTHEHSDHTAGLDDIRPFYFRQGAISFYAHKRVFEALHQRFAYIFATENKYPGAPSITEVEVSKESSFELFGKTITPVEAMHADLPVLGFRIDNFVYLTDVKTISDTELEKLNNLEVLVINALREESHQSHLNLEEALDMAKRIGAKTTYFTHISHLLGFHAEVEERLPENVHLAYDTLTITL